MGETDVERRISEIERRTGILEKGMDDLREQIAENTDTTNAIKRDTSQIVTLFKASQLGASIVKWLATVGGGAIVAYAAFKGVMHS